MTLKESPGRHTPGPWTVSEHNVLHIDAIAVPFKSGPAGIESIARVWRTPRAEANARLIAAAPDLLAALEKIVLRLEVEEAESEGAGFLGAALLPELQAAIARAKGEEVPAQA